MLPVDGESGNGKFEVEKSCTCQDGGDMRLSMTMMESGRSTVGPGRTRRTVYANDSSQRVRL